MFSSNPVRKRRHRLHIIDGDDCAIILPGLPCHLFPRQGSQRSLHRITNRICKIRIIGNQDGLRRLVMLGLRQQIHGNPGGIIAGIGDHQNFRRASN